MAQTGMIHDLVLKISNNEQLTKRERLEFVSYLRSLEENTSIIRGAVSNLQTIINQTYYSGGVEIIIYDPGSGGFVGNKQLVGGYAKTVTGSYFSESPRISRLSSIVVYNLYLTARVDTTNDASNYYTMTLWLSNGDDSHAPSGWSVNTSGEVADDYVHFDIDNRLAPYVLSTGSYPDHYGMQWIKVSKTGSPGHLDFWWSMEYRHVAIQV